jgi:hypothetical protein
VIAGKAIKIETHRTADLTDPAQSDAPIDIHLEEAVLRLDVSLSKEEIMLRLGEYVGDAPAVTDDFDRALQAVQPNLTG